MKRINIAYWIITGLFCAMMLFSGITNLLVIPGAGTLISGNLLYPEYFIPFIGLAKILGVIALLVPGWPRVKEWAYAGFTYDLVGAIWSGISMGDPVSVWITIVLFIAALVASYVLHHKRLSATV